MKVDKSDREWLNSLSPEDIYLLPDVDCRTCGADENQECLAEGTEPFTWRDPDMKEGVLLTQNYHPERVLDARVLDITQREVWEAAARARGDRTDADYTTRDLSYLDPCDASSDYAKYYL